MTTEQKAGRGQHNEDLVARLHDSVQTDINEMLGKVSLSDRELVRFVSWVALDVAFAETTDTEIEKGVITTFLPNRENPEVIIEQSGTEEAGNSTAELKFMTSGLLPSEVIRWRQGVYRWRSTVKGLYNEFGNKAIAERIFDPYQRRENAPVSQPTH